MPPLLDVSEALTDPNFLDDFIVRRSTESVVDGFAQEGTTDIPAKGVVVPVGPGQIERTSDAERQTDAITVYTAFQLSTGSRSSGLSADTIVWGGSNWTVIDADPWAFGSGFTVATALLESLNG